MTAGLILDTWQKQVIETKGNICLRSGRQVGKSEVVSIKASRFALENPNKKIMVIASTERQAQLLFDRILNKIYETAKASIKTGKDKPTKHIIQLKNGSIIYCYPTGRTGYGIRGYTIHLLIVDEASFVPDEVFQAVTPMLSVTKGNIILLSTPFGREGYFANCFKSPNFTQFHISSEDCPRISKSFLAQEKSRMTRVQYAQEYLGEFVDELMQLFPDNLIRKCQILKRRITLPSHKSEVYLGVDIARMGGDETAFEIVEKINPVKFQHIENITRVNNYITDTIEEIKTLDRSYNFRKIYIDDGGLGVGVFDALLKEDNFKRRIVAVNNARRTIEYNPDKTPKRKTLLKEDLYNNLLNLMEKGQIELLDDESVFQSLRSVQYEYSERGQLKIFGRYTHITEGLIRSCWSVNEKSLNIWIRSV